ncbi:MAG: hypothetical protein ACKPKO_18580, partial [Candidatus Fonsibacter sp.]
PFRNRREHCIRGRAKSSLHKLVSGASEIPIVGIGYMWMISERDQGEDRQCRGMPILVAADQRTGWIWGMGSAGKGRSLVCSEMLVWEFRRIGTENDHSEE